MEYPFPMQLPERVLAAFPLDFYNGKAGAVIDEEEIANPAHDVFVFHEFVHCYQFGSCERALRAPLRIEKSHREQNDFMWEINYAFPYDNDVFTRMTAELDDALQKDPRGACLRYHRAIRNAVSEIDYEYMIWQEWKEGFARYVENLTRDQLRLPARREISKPPYDRSVLYETGSASIQALAQRDPSLPNDIQRLFFALSDAANAEA